MLIDYYIEALLRDPEAADKVWEALDQDQISEYVAAAGTDKLTSPDKCNLANFHQATAAFHSLNALILRFR